MSGLPMLPVNPDTHTIGALNECGGYISALQPVLGLPVRRDHTS
jgi:hypothetical protein